MSFLAKITSCAFILIFLVSIPTPSGRQQANGDLLSHPIPFFKAEQSTIHQVLKEVAATYRIPIGFEAITMSGSELETSININLQNGTVRDILDIITSADPRYQWEVTDEVINVYPKIRQNSILEVIVQDFKINLKNKSSIKEAITNLTEVKSMLRSLNVQPIQVTVGPLGIADNPSIILQLQNVTVRKILNEIAKQSDTYYWVVSRFGKQREFLTINF